MVIFNENLAKIAEQYLRKGSTVYIEGQLQTRKWQDQSGQERYTTEIVLQRYRGELTLLGGRGEGGGGGRDLPDYGDGSADFGASSPMESRGGGRSGGGGGRPAAAARRAAASAPTWTTRSRSEPAHPAKAPSVPQHDDRVGTERHVRRRADGGGGASARLKMSRARETPAARTFTRMTEPRK